MGAQGEERRSRLGVNPQAVALGLYLVVALYFLWPMPERPLTTVIQTSGDASWNLWWIWWTRHALARGLPLFFTDRLMYPTGAPLGLSRPDLTSMIVSLPLHDLPLAGIYNVLILGALVFSGFAMFVLARAVTGSVPGALVAGAVFAFMPLTSRSTNLGHLEWTNVGFIPLAILGLLRVREGGLLRVVPRAVPLALAMCVSWYQGIFLFMFAFVYCIDALWFRPPGWSRTETLGLLGRVAGWAGAGLVMVAPLLLPVVREARANPVAEVRRDWVSLNSAEPPDPFRPNPLNPLLGTASDRPACSFGYAVLALGALGVRAARARARLWLLVVVAFYVLALGPALPLGGREWPLPYAVLYGLPLGNILRVPLRLLFVAGLGAALLVAWGVAWLHERAQQRGWPPLVTGIALAAVLLEYWPGARPVTAMDVDPFYTNLARERAEGAVLELPASIISHAMYWQTIHGRPIIEGYFSRKRPEARRNAELPVIRQLWIGDANTLPELTRPDIVRQPQLLARGAELLDAYGVRYVVLHRDALRQETALLEEYLDRMFPASARLPLRGPLAVYRVPVHASLRGVVAGVGPGWEPPEMFPEDAEKYRWCTQEGSIALMLLDRSPRPVLLSASALGYRQVRTVEVILNDAPLTTLDLPPRWSTVALGLPLMPGYNLVTLRTSTPAGRAGDRRMLAFALGRVQIEGQ